VLECWSGFRWGEEGGQGPGEAPPSEGEKPDKSPEIAPKSTAKTEKQLESGRLPEATVPSTPAQPYPLQNASNTPTVPSDGQGNGHTVWPRAISDSPEDRQEPPPGAVFAKVVIREVWPPALGPPGDDVFDIDSEWQQ
jgi:hypothetical protein